jgi:hypothetical protein
MRRRIHAQVLSHGASLRWVPSAGQKKSQEVIIQYTVNSQYLKALHFENFCQEMREGGFLWLFFVLTFENYFGEFLPGVPGSGLLVWW